MIFGKWNPLGALGGALLFGFADALQIKLQIVGVNVPYQFLGMVPYLVTMFVLAGVIGRGLPPAASGIPYDKDS
jgi:simple sugar transport system permease protein